MTPEEKNKIDNMNYEDMFRRWRFAPIGDPQFQAETGDYFAKVMFQKKKEVEDAAHTAISKKIGWN
jgi:hypothetical protein